MTGSVWKQERPAWCPHASCRFIVRSQDAICIGELPEPQDHAGTPNTHRLCQRGAPDDGEWLHSVEWNRGDAWNLWRCLKAAFGFALAGEVVPVVDEPDLSRLHLKLLKRGANSKSGRIGLIDDSVFRVGEIRALGDLHRWGFAEDDPGPFPPGPPSLTPSVITNAGRKAFAAASPSTPAEGDER